MWDSNAPLQLLKSMPQKLSKENLEKLQMVIDADKYKNSLVCGFDLCGMYAPFCRDCKKTSIFPCALAYVNMMKESGMDVDIDAKPVAEPDITKLMPQTEMAAQPETAVVEETAVAVDEEVIQSQTVEEIEDVNSAEHDVEFIKTEQPVNNVEEIQPIAETAPQSDEEPVKHKIRIAVARRKL